jgi:hypothetical protein
MEPGPPRAAQSGDIATTLGVPQQMLAEPRARCRRTFDGLEFFECIIVPCHP